MIIKDTENSTKQQLSPKLSETGNPSSNFLGNITSYSAPPVNKGIPEIERLKYDYKKLKYQQKTKIGKKIKRVSYCGTRCICKGETTINMVQGEKGGIYYQNMQRCGSVWFCPDCGYKIMKTRADELYEQLKIYKDNGKTILFVTFTLQHNQSDRLIDLHHKLLKAFDFANSSKAWAKAKKEFPVEYLRALEVLKGLKGWHPHLHVVFVGCDALVDIINIFVDLYKQQLRKYGLVTNEHTVVVDKWNGKLENMSDYMFKGMLEYELVGGNLKKSVNGKTFFDLINDNNDSAAAEFIAVMKGKRQYHSSRKFFGDVRMKTESEILKDDKVANILFSIPVEIYSDILKKGIALHLLNEYSYGGKDRAVRLLELYDCDATFFEKSEKSIQDE